MTPQEINERIATICGKGNLYFVKKRGLYYRPNAQGYTSDKKDAWRIPFEEAKLHQYDCDELPVTIHKCEPPDYFNSLVACATFESCLTGDDRSLYMDHVYLLIVRSNNKAVMGFENQWAMFNATPAQRCEAFLRMKGQWE